MFNFSRILHGSVLAINAVIAFLGFALTIMGLVIWVRGEPFHSYFDVTYISFHAFAIIFGLIVTGLFTAGFFGNLRKSIHLTIAFSMLSCVILLVIFSCAIVFCMTFTWIMNGSLQQQLESSFTRYSTGVDTDYQLWDYYQRIGHCCGVNGSSDYKSWNFSIPLSCCINKDAPCATTNSTQIFTDGCYAMLEGQSSNIRDISYSLFGVSGFMVLLCAGSLYLARNVYRGDYAFFVAEDDS